MRLFSLAGHRVSRSTTRERQPQPPRPGNTVTHRVWADPEHAGVKRGRQNTQRMFASNIQENQFEQSVSSGSAGVLAGTEIAKKVAFDDFNLPWCKFVLRLLEMEVRQCPSLLGPGGRRLYGTATPHWTLDGIFNLIKRVYTCLAHGPDATADLVVPANRSPPRMGDQGSKHCRNFF